MQGGIGNNEFVRRDHLPSWKARVHYFLPCDWAVAHLPSFSNYKVKIGKFIKEKEGRTV